MMGNFIKILLIKRLESGSYSFKKSIDNSIKIHEKVLKTFQEEGVFITGKHYTVKALDLIEEENLEEIERLIKEDKITRYQKDEFYPKFQDDIKHDLDILEHIQKRWQSIEEYPKRHRLVDLLNGNHLNDKKIIIFTEFIDTAKDIGKLIDKNCSGNVLVFTGNSSREDRETVLLNFDANIPKENQKNDYRILIATDTLSHGVNLHRSNVIINFDIPWNPTKMMQRVGRVQRLDTKFDEIFTYNFFPTEPIEDNLKIQFYAEKKIAMFIELLGNDSQLLTDEPIQSYDLFNQLTSDFMDEEELVDDELKYLRLIRDIRDKDFELFKKIEEIPKKARVGRKSNNTSLISLLKTGKFKKVFKATPNDITEIDFFDAIRELKAEPDEKGIPVNEDYYVYLHNNLSSFDEILNNPEDERKLTRNENTILKYVDMALQNKSELISYDINFLVKVRELVVDGHITKKRAKDIKAKLTQSKDVENIIDSLRKAIPEEDLKTNTSTSKSHEQEHKQIILSEYFMGD